MEAQAGFHAWGFSLHPNKTSASRDISESLDEPLGVRPAAAGRLLLSNHGTPGSPLCRRDCLNAQPIRFALSSKRRSKRRTPKIPPW
jgi:hypothetical protein